MKNIKKHIQNFLKDESGQGTTEYILMLVGIVAVVFALSGPLSDGIGDAWEKVKVRILTAIASIG